MGGALTSVKRWLTYKLTTIASQLDGELFIRLCEVAVILHHRKTIEETIEEAVALVNYLQEQDDDNHTDTTNHRLH